MDKLSYNYQIWTQIWVRPDFFWTKKVQNPKFSAEQKGQIFEKSHQASSPIIRGPVLTNWPDTAYSNSDTRLIELPNSKVDDIHTPLTSHGMTIWWQLGEKYIDNALENFVHLVDRNWSIKSLKYMVELCVPIFGYELNEKIQKLQFAHLEQL
jgi:hypothetical protein